MNAPSTAGDAIALPRILPSKGLVLLWQRHVLQSPARHNLWHIYERCPNSGRFLTATQVTLSYTYTPIFTCRHVRYKAVDFWMVVHRALTFPKNKQLNLGKKKCHLLGKINKGYQKATRNITVMKYKPCYKASSIARPSPPLRSQFLLTK